MTTTKEELKREASKLGAFPHNAEETQLVINLIDALRLIDKAYEAGQKSMEGYTIGESTGR